MPEADFEFRQTLKSAELANLGGMRRSIHVVLKDDQDAAKRYMRYFGLSPVQIHQQGLSEFVEPGFSEWLKTLGHAL